MGKSLPPIPVTAHFLNNSTNSSLEYEVISFTNFLETVFSNLSLDITTHGTFSPLKYKHSLISKTVPLTGDSIGKSKSFLTPILVPFFTFLPFFAVAVHKTPQFIRGTYTLEGLLTSTISVEIDKSFLPSITIPAISNTPLR